MLRTVWENRDNLGQAWRILSKGVCDGCALGVSGFHDWTIDSVHLCQTRLSLLRLNTMGPLEAGRLADVAPLRSMSNAELMRMGRLASPMVRRAGDRGFKPIGWDEVIALAAERIRRAGPERIAFYLTSRGLTNETYYVAQKAARLLGTNHIDNAARLCHAPSTVSMKRSLGVAASTCSYRDWLEADLLVFFGSNPANDQPVTTKYLHAAKKNGARIALVNPVLEPGMERYWVPSTLSSAVFGTQLTDFHYPVHTGGDLAFLFGVVKQLIAMGAVDHEFIESHTRGFEQLRAAAGAMDEADLERRSGVSRERFDEFARLLAGTKRAVFIWSMGITQHSHGSDAVSMIVNLALLRGFVGRAGCGLMPIRGHSGVQGAAEMGAYATALPGGVTIDSDSAARLSELYGFSVPDRRGIKTAEMLEAAGRGELDVLYTVGGNFLRTMPQPDDVAAAMGRVQTRIHQDLIATDQMLIDPPGGEGVVLLLPAATRYEQEGGGTETTTERRVLYSPEIAPPPGEARSEWRILRDVALAATSHGEDVKQRFGCDTGQAIRREIARIVPFYDGIQQLARAGDQFQWGGERLCETGVFPTEDGRAVIFTPTLPADSSSPPATFRLSTRRGRQFNTMVHRKVDPLTGAARDAVLMNCDDAARLGLSEGERVSVRSEYGELMGRVHHAPIAPGNVQVHWPEGNVLLDASRRDELSGVPDYNTLVSVVRHDAALRSS